MNFGDIVVGSSASRELTIHNNSDCSLHYNLFIDQEVTGPYDDDQTARDVLGNLLFPYYTSEVYPLDVKHLMTGPEGFPENLNVSRDGAEGNIEIRGKQN